MVTTPQLHFTILKANIDGAHRLDEDAYIHHLVNGYHRLASRLNGERKEHLIVDCANGAGSKVLSYLAESRQFRNFKVGATKPLRIGKAECSFFSPSLSRFRQMRNIRWQSSSQEPMEGEAHMINHRCGSDFVQKERLLPQGFSPGDDAGQAACSVDGDADRIVFFVPQAEGGVQLVDGDRIACLFARHIAPLLQAEGMPDLRAAVVQTAYSNSASTEFLQRLPRFSVEMVKTGTGSFSSLSLFDGGEGLPQRIVGWKCAQA